MFKFKKTYPTPSEITVGINTKEYVIVHGTGTPSGTIKGVLDGLYRRKDYASCHFVVDVNGDAYKIGSPDDIQWHAGVSEWKGKKDLNKYSLGIEVIGIDSFTDAQLATVKKLTEHLMAAFKIPKENVLRHADIAIPKGRKTDIHLNFIKPLTKWTDWQKTLNPKLV